jgi:hypothetical protein
MVVHGVPVSLAHNVILGGQVLQVSASIGLIFGIYPRLAGCPDRGPDSNSPYRPCLLQAAATPLDTVQVINFCKRVYLVGGLTFVAATKSNLFCFHVQRANRHIRCSSQSDYAFCQRVFCVRRSHFNPIKKSVGFTRDGSHAEYIQVPVDSRDSELGSLCAARHNAGRGADKNPSSRALI